MRISSLLLTMAALAGGEAATIEIRCLGQTVIDSGATRAVEGSAKGLLVDQLGADGRDVQVGDCIVVFNPEQIAKQLDDRRRAAVIAGLDFATWRADRDSGLAALAAERRRLQAEFTSVRAAISLQTLSDPDRIALLDIQHRQAELDASLAEREALRSTEEQAHGQISFAALAAAKLEAELAHLRVAGPALAWRLQVKPDGEPVSLALLRVAERDLMVQLGLDASGQESRNLGIGARLAGAQEQLEADAAARRADLDRAEADLRQAEREVKDHTPLAWIEIRPDGADSPLLRFRFAPAGHPDEAGWTTDHGEVFATGNGYGWDRAIRAAELPWREAAASTPLPAAASQPRGGGKTKRNGKPAGGQSTATWVGGLALLEEPATWSVAIPNGPYRVTVGLGDNRAWDGAALRAEGAAFSLSPRLAAGITSVSAIVTVADGRLDVQVGDAIAKAIRAETAGVVVFQPNIRPGYRVEDPSRALAFVAERESFVIDALVAQELAPLLAPARKATAAGNVELIDRLLCNGLELLRRDGTRIPAEVVAVGGHSVRWTRGPRSWGQSNPDDDLAREIRLRPLAGKRGQLVIGENVEVVIRLGLPTGTTALPPHLVRIDRDGALIRVDGQQRAVRAVRVGTVTVIDASVDPARCQVPGIREEIAAEIAAGRFRGGVVPGRRTRVSASWVWGRVESLVADGSEVRDGQVILTIYNPQIEANQERSERERKAAVKNVVAAAERRHQAELVVRGEHAARIIAETAARVRLRHHFDGDPLAAIQGDTAMRITAAGVREAQAILDRHRALAAPRPDDLASATASQAIAAVSADRARLAAAQQELSADWLLGQDLAAAWTDRVRELARREAEIGEAAVQEQINTLADRIAMERAVGGNGWERYFADKRLVKAPEAGRVAFSTGWNDQSQRSEKIGPEFPVWGGMSVAEILDERSLGFTAELPDDCFRRLAKGQICELELADAPGRTIQANLSEIGRAFTIPRDRLGGGSDQGDAVTNRRVFQVTASFAPPEDLRGRITTGAKGWLRIP